MTPTIAAWGGGVNSTAMVIGWLARGEPLDLIMFADTGGEKPQTYAFRDLFVLWLKRERKNLPFVTVQKDGKDATLEAECLRLKTLPSKAFGLPRCSDHWKRRPQDAFVRDWEPAKATWAMGLKVVKLIGYDADETRRAANMKNRDDPRYEFRHPLIEWGWDRDACAVAIERAGLPVPPKSACFFCPSSKQREIIQLQKDNPDLMQRALAMEANYTPQPGGSTIGLGWTWRWRDVLERDRRQGKLFQDPPELPCACFDGGPADDD